MPIRKERLNAGLVQTRHPTLFREGELQTADDTILRPGDIAIHKAPGRTAYGTVASTSISCTTDGTAALTSSNAFGTAVANCDVDDGSSTVTTSGNFNAISEGQTVVGTGISGQTYVRRKVSSTEIELTQVATTSTDPVTLYFSDIHVGTRITGTGIPTDALITAITDDSNLTMSQSATDSTTTSRTFSESVQGLRTLVFDGQSTNLLLTQAADTLYTSPLSDTSDPITGTFTSLITNLTHDDTSGLETIQVKNRHVALTGLDAPQIIRYSDDSTDPTNEAIAIRALGMQPVTDFDGPGIIKDGSWSALEEFREGWYYFVVTEVLLLGEDDEVEGTYEGDPLGVQITDHLTQGIRVTYKDAAVSSVNDGLYGRNTATHWRIYMAKSNSQFPSPDLAEFTRVATVDIATVSVDINVDNPFQAGYATDLAVIAGKAALFPGGNTLALSTVVRQSVADCTYTVDDDKVTSAGAGFGTIQAGMSVTSADDDLPFGTIVDSVTDNSNITLSELPTAAGTTKTLYFGASKWGGAVAGMPPPDGPDGTDVRKRRFEDFGIQNQGGFSTSTITGVVVEVRGYLDTNNTTGGTHGLAVTLEKGAIGGTESTEKTFLLPVGKLTVAKLGDPLDNWGIAWVPGDFIDGASTFGVNIRQGFTSNWVYRIDGVRITIYGGAGILNSEDVPFRVITVSDQLGTAFGSGANGAPPIASTGDMFDGQLLLNDIEDESVVAGSLPDEEEAFPDVYRIPLESKNNDQVRVIRRLNNICIIGCLNSVKRLNYFPKETDADFTRGRAYEDIATDHGMVGPRAAQLLELPGRGTILAYLSHNGLHWTDGVTTNFLNDDIDWESLFRSTNIAQSVLEVYSRLSILALYYIPSGASVSKKTKALYFSYHPAHVKEGFRLPATGPVSVGGESATTALIGGVPYLFTGHSTDGKVYQEDSGTSDDSGGDILPVVRTRRLWAADIGRQGRVERALLLTDAAGNATTGGITMKARSQNHGEAVAVKKTDDTKDTSVGGVIKFFANQMLEAFDIEVSKSAAETSALRLHYIGYDVTPDGQDQSN